MTEREPAKCRYCQKILKGDAYKYGGKAYHPINGELCSINYYGGFVCSKRCDYLASLELERSMPGHGWGQTKLGHFSHEASEKKWGNK